MLSGPGGEAPPDAAAEALADTGPPLTTYELSLDSAAPARPTGPVPEVRGDAPPPAGVAETGRDAAAVAGGSAVNAASGPDQAARNREAAQGAPASRAATPQDRPATTSPAPATSRQAAAAPRATTPAPANQSRAAQQSEPRAASPTPAQTSPPAAATGNWWVQLGSFSSEENARGLAARMRERGFTIQVSKVRSGNRDLFRVRAGPVKDRESAEALRSRLAAAGQQATLVAP